MLIFVGALAIAAGALLISPGVRNALWSVRTWFSRVSAGDAGSPPAFADRLMNVAIVVVLLGVGLVVAGFVRAG